MSSIVKLGSALYFKVSASLERDNMEELLSLKEAFEKSGDESFVFDFSGLQSATGRACDVLATIQEEARRKGQVYVLTPPRKMLKQMLDLHTIKMSELYENRTLIGQAMKEKVKGNIPVT